MLLQFYCVLLMLCHGCALLTNAEPVRVYAADLTDMKKKPLAGLPIAVLETAESFITDANGYLHLDYPKGQMLTFVSQTHGDYHELQSGTVIVPRGGLNTTETEVVLQVPTNFMFDLLLTLTNGKKDPTKCQVVVTVCNRGRTVYSFPQGIPGAVATISADAASTHTYYFGTWGKLSNYTNPLPNDLTSTTWDGGVLFDNVAVNATAVYTVSASLATTQEHFTTSLVRCTSPGRAINAAPNQGPRLV